MHTILMEKCPVGASKQLGTQGLRKCTQAATMPTQQCAANGLRVVPTSSRGFLKDRKIEGRRTLATAVVTLNTWSFEFHQTMAAAEKARLTIVRAQNSAYRVIAQTVLWAPFHVVIRETEKLVALLELVETYPSSILLEEDAAAMPQSLHELFRKMCIVIQLSEEKGLHEGFILKHYIPRLGNLTQQINGFAVRFEDAQNKLRSRVPADAVLQYQESFAAYGNCEPVAEESTEDDVKSNLLRF
jgi:hypothetical protein